MNDDRRDHEESEHEARIAELLRTLDADAAAPRPDVVERVARRAGKEFALSGRDDGAVDDRTVRSKPAGRRIAAGDARIGRFARSSTGKAVVAIVAASVVAFLSFLGSSRTTGSEPTLGAALDRTAAADTLQLKVVRDGAEAEVWIRDSSDVHWRDTPTRYRIASGARLWRIDEEANSVAVESNPWLREEAADQHESESTEKPAPRVDLLALLGVDASAARELRAALPVGRERHAGRDCRVYRLAVAHATRPQVVEAYVDARSGLLLTLAAWPGETDEFGEVDARWKAGPRRGAPLAELRLIARDVPVDDAKFIVAGALSEDGRIGKVIDVQGIVALRPPLARRWTPVAGPLLVKPGDWLRCDVRGANAASIALASRFEATAGPGTLVELRKADRLVLRSGEIHVSGNAAEGATLVVLGPADANESDPDDRSVRVAEPVRVAAGDSIHLRVADDGTLARVEKEPRWLAGFRGATSDESLGSLIAHVDGRNVPLSVGYHKVKVEIRDQIARTTIEESFVNHTAGRLEGVFHFPLPQDASISGFGMWIGGELIEADVVEKQRAREIFEMILRENRDPALLEWAGGNIFKARVFPIEPHSEKRIKIVYTQVLPLRGDTFRYSYALRSEMLRKTPLRDLSLEVLLHSATPLESVLSPTHAVRSQVTKHSAQLDFSAQEYVPTRDFEVVCQVADRQSDVALIPHRRGDDGYFLVQITPPSSDDDQPRDTLPEGEPLDLRLVCDTSGSMDSRSREMQAEFVAAILASLGPDDRFDLAACDVDCAWLFGEAVAPNEERIAKARQWLVERVSLGWTDLDRMVASARARSGKKTHIVYIGDGVPTARDADPQAFADRLRQSTVGRASARPNSDAAATPQAGADGPMSVPFTPAGTFHAVSVGSSFESAALQAMAETGGGSVRHIGGEQTPSKAAFELLDEIARPGLRDLKVEFRGIDVAAVYPEKLPNLAAGTQQIVVGRYLPRGEDQSGEVIVSGRRGDDTVRFAARVSLKDAERGNSFIPRLWARAHLDHLLKQGATPFIRDEIIALSERFHIITPYTSLLVLETDADRERFGVKRRYEMRDGERFFADARDAANFELKRRQMQLADEWRLGLRRQVLAQLAQLGRDPQVFEVRPGWGRAEESYWTTITDGAANVPFDAPFTRGPRRKWASVDFNPLIELIENETFGPWQSIDGFGGEIGQHSTELSLIIRQTQHLLDESVHGVDDDYEGLPARRMSLASHTNLPSRPVRPREVGEVPFGISRDLRRGARSPMVDGQNEIGLRRFLQESSRDRTSIVALFPQVPPPPKPVKAEPRKLQWPAEAIAISEKLAQRPVIDAGGLLFVREVETRDPNWDRTTGKTTTLELFSPRRRLTWSESRWPSLVRWHDGDERGIASRGFDMGTARPAQPRDLDAFPLFTPADFAQVGFPLHVAFWNHEVEIERPAEDRVVLVLAGGSLRITIDTARHALLRVEWRSVDGGVTGATYGDYVHAAGAWWPRKIETFDRKGRVLSRTVQSVELLDEDAFAKRFAAERPDPGRAWLVRSPLPGVRAARIAVADGSAGMDQRLVLLLEAARIQNWDEAFAQLAAIEKLAPEKPGLAWLRVAVLKTARRHEEGRQLLLRQAERLAADARADDLRVAEHMCDMSYSILEANETLELLDRLRPVFDRQPEHFDGPRNWKEMRLDWLRQLGRRDKARSLARELAEAAPWSAWVQTRYADELIAAGEIDAALAWLRREIDRNPERSPHDLDQLRSKYADVLRTDGRYADHLEFIEEWVATNPFTPIAYECYLTALTLVDRDDDACAAVRRWLKEGRVDDWRITAEQTRLNVAVAFALGERDGQRMEWIEPEWIVPLAETARFFLWNHLRNGGSFDVARKITDDWRFADTDESDRLRAEIARKLNDSLDELHVDAIRAHVEWVVHRDDLSRDEWAAIAATLRRMWDEIDHPDVRYPVDEALVAIHRRRLPDEYLPFLRARIRRAQAEEHRPHVASAATGLFHELLYREWEPAHETESLELLPLLSGWDTPARRLTASVTQLHHWTDRMVHSRVAAATTRLQDTGRPDRLTRTELAAKHAEILAEARQEVAASLSAEIVREPGADATPDDVAFRDALRPWLRMERAYLDVQSERDLPRVAEECWAILGDAPPAADEDDGALEEPADDVAANQEMEAAHHRAAIGALRRRAFATATFLAVRRDAPLESVERLLRYVAAGAERKGDAALTWKEARFALLVALDRPDDLERELRAWIRADEFPAPWRLALGRLVAERGRIDEAITLFETARDEAPLDPQDHAALAAWHLVMGDRDRHDRARFAMYVAMEEAQLAHLLRVIAVQRSFESTPTPAELDEDSLLVLQALFEKSGEPGNYVGQLRQLYTNFRDFRLLRMAPDSVIGRTPRQVYHFLGAVHSSLLAEVRDEAAADEIMGRLKELRRTAKSAIDLRALDLLEALVERRSSEVLDQPGPHVEAALAALRRAFDRDWAEGEVRMMSDFLSGLGTISQAPLADERLRQLRELHRLTEPGTDDRLFVALRLTGVLFHRHDRRDEALAVLEAAIREFEQAHPDGWPAHANSYLESYVGYLQRPKRYAAAEAVLDRHLANPLNPAQREWLEARRDQLFHEALAGDGTVSLGTGETLYRNLVEHLLEQTQAENEYRRYQALEQLHQVFQTAHQKEYDYHPDLRKYAFESLPEMLKRQTGYYSNLVSDAASLLRERLGPREALEFLLDRIETYPARANHAAGAWQQFAGQLAQCHTLVKSADGKDPAVVELEARLLKLVLAELRRELLTNRQSTSYFHRGDGTYFWVEKKEEFARVAEEVLAERGESGRFAAHVAQYLRDTLQRNERAVAILLAAPERGRLSLASRSMLCDWLHHDGRYAEAIPLLEALVEDQPETMAYRTRLLAACVLAGRDREARRVLARADAYFRDGGRWIEQNIAQLAASCLELGLHAEAAGYFGEAIAVHQRTRSDRGVGNETLSGYYRQQAAAYSALGKTRDAANAAAAAIVAWGPRQRQRADGVAQLDQVLESAADLDEYITHLDRQAAETGQDSPLIRQRIGAVLAGRNEYAKAIPQLKIAIDLQPNDPATRRELIAACDAVGDPQEVIRQMLVLLDLERHDLDLHIGFAHRVMGDALLAERAATNIVEAAPREAEHHQALAVFRQEQDRWAEAIPHWEHVARLRALEPDGLIGLTEAQIHLRRREDARASLARLRETQWPARFANVRSEADRLERLIPGTP
ncbi:MAG: VIT domain-containing protein [Planctomycetaceae bacterium]